MVVVGMDIMEGNGDGKHFFDGSDLIVNHIEKVMQHPCFCQSKIVLVIEAVHHVDVVGQYSHQVLDYFKSINQLDRIFIEKDMPHPDAYGVGKTERMSWDMAKLTRDYLREDYINFSTTMISAQPEVCQKLILLQLGSFHVIKKIKPDGTTQALIRSKGKDDLAICLQSILLHESRIRTYSSRFKDWANQIVQFTQIPYQKNYKRQRVIQ
jgi:hypothetical protein